MKKNLFLCMLAVAGMLFATSCSQDELRDEISAGDYVTATFSISTPDAIDTRAGATNVGKGITVNYVACAVYDATGTEMEDLRQYVGIQNKKAQYSIRLVKGQAYRIAFFAYCGEDNGDCDYYNLTDLTNIQVTLPINSNLEERDAFTNYEIVTAEESMKPIEREITLYRPFAQLNLGSVQADIDAAKHAGVEVANTQIKVSNVYTAFNAYENVVAGQTSTVTFDLNEIPAEALLVDTDQDGTDETFKYLALNYLLVGDLTSGKSLTDVEFVWKNADGSKTNNPTTIFTNVPVERNYRTNIIGYLLTNPAVFNITIDEEFKKPDYIVSIWDGETVTPPTEANNEILINSAAEFVALMETTGNSIYIGKTIKLLCDIDLGGNTVKGIGGDSNFAGTFDGNGFTISNFKIDASNRTYYAGLFNQVSHGGYIKNLTVRNATVKGNSMVGAVASSLDSNATIENCKAYDCHLIGVKKVGSVVGYSAGSTVKDNYAENCLIECTEKEAGEVLGFENTGSTVTGNSCKDITIKAVASVLAAALKNVVNGEINLNSDYIVTGDWTSIKPVGSTTVNGNGHTIKGINKPLFAGYGGSKFTVNDLTIADSSIGVATVENGLGTGAFLAYLDYDGEVVFDNCHLLRSSVTGNERAAALVGYNEGDKVTITNCSVVECDIIAVGGAGGFMAYTCGGDMLIKDSKIEKTTVESTEDRTGKTALAGAVVGTINNCAATFTNVTVDAATTVTNNGATPHSKEVGRLQGTATLN